MDSLVTIAGGNIRADVNQSPPTTNTLPSSISNTQNIVTDVLHPNSTINTSTHPSNNTINVISQTQQSLPYPTDVSNISATSSFILTPTNNDEIITAHHEDKVYTLTSHFCLPVNQTPLNDNYVCKFPNRDCVMKRCKIFDGSGSQNLHQLSETVFSPPNKLTGTLKYRVVDSRIIKCCQPACTNGLDSNPKLFHFSCYIHSFLKSDNKGMKIVSVTNENDKILEFLNMPEHVLNEVKSVLRNGTSVTFPCCGKRCYKIVAAGKIQKKKVPTSSSTCTSPNITNNTNPNWDKDGSNTVRSSIQILIDWLTTEENATNYFGGLDKDGRTSSDRKETYHNYISEKIQKENGSIRTPDSVRTKIVRILQGYKKAHDHINNTGAGLHGIEFCNYQDKVVNTHCRFYFALNPILGQRPNVKPWYTNKFDDNNDDEDNTNECDDESVETTDNNRVDFDIDEEIRSVQRDTPVTIGSKRSQVINLSCSEDDTVSVTVNMTSESSGGQCNVDSSSSSSDGVLIVLDL